ncbi:TPA: hypothetical protein R7S54_001638 [Acinetobacter baumannii]|nr:hypothetical protein [Acinetobacter baumannii]
MGFLFENKRQVWLLVILIILIWLVFPFLFKAFMSWMSWIGADLQTFADYGPVGDIYGSLNTLFTSATLIIVMYSAYLQRQANKDARDAMAEQLQQARDATAKQLRQARQSTRQQLELAQKTHDAQLTESKYAIFINGFNSLLNYKHERYMSIQTTKGTRTYLAHEVFTHLNISLIQHTQNEWKDISKVTSEQVEKNFYLTMKEISNIGNHSDIIGYFYMVRDLYNYINRSCISEEDKDFYKSIVLNSMSSGEQAALYWIGAFTSELNMLTRREKCFDFGYHEDMMPFSIKFYSKECFGKNIQNNWEVRLPK